MKSRLLGTAIACAICLSTTMPAGASFVLVGGTTQSLPITGNNFNAGLGAQNFDQMTYGSQLRVSQGGFVDFLYIGAESGFTNTIASGAHALTEHNEAFDFSGYSGFTIAVSAGDTLNFTFTSDNVKALTPVDNFNGTNLQGLGIVYNSSQVGSLLQVVLGYDDQYLNDDDNHDDMMVRADFRPVPVPLSVWLLGTGLLGMAGIGRRKQV